MSQFPCPKCETERESLEATCESCGWSPIRGRASTNPIQVVRTKWFTSRLKYAIAYVSLIHFALVMICFLGLPDSAWSMEGSPGNLSPSEKLATLGFFTLNMPLLYVGIRACALLGLPLVWLWPWFIANSVLWSVTICVGYKILSSGHSTKKYG